MDIVPPEFPAERLLVCEVFTPSGNWSSYPPHKHDTDNPPREVDLEEIYYFRYQDADGYGFQRVYNESPRRDRFASPTATSSPSATDIIPFVTAYGYDAYYLNVLAGDRRSMAASDDPRYAEVPARLAAARPPAAAGAAAGRRRTACIGFVTGGVFPMTRLENSILEELHETDVARHARSHRRVPAECTRRLRHRSIAPR